MIDVARWDLQALAATWRSATPFSHLVVDDLVDEAHFRQLLLAAGHEPHLPNRAEIYDFFASELPPEHPDLRAFIEELGSANVREALAAITGETTERVELRSYFYAPGHYLLPHRDHHVGAKRKLAYAYYLMVPTTEAGGELELFTTELVGSHIVAAQSAKRIAPVVNRIAIFEVSDRSLHQVREITDGARISLAGWFY